MSTIGQIPAPPPRPPPAELQSARTLIGQGRLAEAVGLLGPVVRAQDPPLDAVAAYVMALRGLGRAAEAVVVLEAAASRHPDNPIVWHNLSRALCDAGRGAAAAAAAQRALALGLDAPEAWLALARGARLALQLDEAERGYREALRRAPALCDAAVESAALAWSRRRDLAEALSPLDAALAAGAPEPDLALARAALQRAAGSGAALTADLDSALDRNPDAPQLLFRRAHLALRAGEPGKAIALAERGAALVAGTPAARLELAAVYLAAGRTEAARTEAEAAVRADPDNQAAWCWLATVARAQGDPLHRRLCDYPALVRSFRIAAPQGWPDLDAWLRDLAVALEWLHGPGLEPLDQSLSGGSQTVAPLETADDPAIRAFFGAIDEPVRRYLAEIGAGEGPLRSRNRGGYRTHGAWSVRLQPGGVHLNHFHPLGWISSAFYVRLPAVMAPGGGREGWLAFGEPNLAGGPDLPAEHHVRPEPGLLVLFPSYLWHGTLPFAGEDTRLTIAFDLLPA